MEDKTFGEKILALQTLIKVHEEVTDASVVEAASAKMIEIINSIKL